MADPRDTMRWVWRGSALAALAIGWLFIAWQNHFHISAPMVFVGLGYLAVVATIYNLWRTGAAVAGAEDDGRDSTWAKPVGAIGELEREKRTLLKAIKEAEFDHQMGKLSKHDADDMIRTYRARAIEVIKEIDQLGQGGAGSAREQILREVRARLELEARSRKKADARPAPNGAEPRGQKAKAGKAAKAAAAESAPATTEPAASDAEAAAQAAAPAARPTLDDDAMDADSTTTVESAREDREDSAKEATP